MNDKVNALYERLNANANLEKSAVELVHGMADMFEGMAFDPPGIKTLIAELKGSAPLLGAAVLNATHPHPTPPVQSAPAMGVRSDDPFPDPKAKHHK